MYVKLSLCIVLLGDNESLQGQQNVSLLTMK
jgi:hypothetical protein